MDSARTKSRGMTTRDAESSSISGIFVALSAAARDGAGRRVANNAEVSV